MTRLHKKQFLILTLLCSVILMVRMESIQAGITSDLDLELQSLLKLDLEQLATISVASKREERMQEAPGIVTVITAKEIQQFGARNLRDVLDRQTNLQTHGSNFFPGNRSTMRGVIQAHHDNNVLLLMNGRPIRDANNGGINMDIYNMFPLEIIERIEIIRGPGSVLYGTNAFSGVINLVTKSSNENTNNTGVSVSYGSFDHKQSTINNVGNYNGLNYMGAIKLQDIDGDSFDNITDNLGATGTYNTGQAGIHAAVSADYKGLKINSLFTKLKLDAKGAAASSISLDGQFDFERYYFDIGYRHTLTSNWDIELHSTTNILRLDFPIPFPLPTGGRDFINADSFLLEATSYTQLSKDINLIIGGTFDVITGELDQANGDYSAERRGLYAQIDYQLTDWLKLIGGIQWNKPEESDSDISPRFGIISKFNNSWGIKLLYGEAFRSPFGADLFLDVTAIKGNRALIPEKIKTIDAQLSYLSGETSLALTAYYSKHSDIHSRTRLFPATFINEGTIKYYGIEIEGKTSLTETLSFIGNSSYQINKNDNGNYDVTVAPSWMIKTGLVYEPQEGMSLSIFNSYFSKPTPLRDFSTASIAHVNPEAESYNLLTANLKFNLGKLFQNSLFNRTDFALYADNLLDENIFFPDINPPSVNSLPHHFGRGFYATLSTEF